MAIIKTPDQRVRVFISSTINELADERRAAREAIESLRLIPVFFEAGARPHPPRDLYSAYLEQSHIFLGIYWNSYGWIAPGAEISGLEDEYRLCGNRKPKLIYVKNSEERQSRLNELLADIEKSDSACYQKFNDAEELKRLIQNDLSVMMSEMFENALSEASQQPPVVEASMVELHKKRIELPLIKSELIGRDEDMDKLSQLLTDPTVSLLTLLGAGGTGKTSLAIHAAHKVTPHFKDGVVFVPLAPVTDPALVAPTIAELLGVQDSGKEAIDATLVNYLTDKNYLLVLDNFEQVMDASQLVSNLLAHCREVTVLVTTRTSLHIRYERIYNLGMLRLPDAGVRISPDELHHFSATRLFVERALAVNPSMPFTAENTEAILNICQRMDGLPLAIELAAVRTRFFQPAALMSRIEKTLDLVSKGHKDLPQRQQTLRGAIEWSYNLLSEETQKVFRQLGAFKRSWTLEAADAVLNDGKNMVDVEEMTERLLDVSLIKPVLVSHSAEPRFNMLQTVHEYASEMLDNAPEANETRQRYAEYFLQLCEQSEGLLWGHQSEAWLEKIEYEYQNIRAAFHFFLHQHQHAAACKFITLLTPYWTIRGGISEGDAWIDLLNPIQLTPQNDEELRAIGSSLCWAGFIKYYMLKVEGGFALHERALELLEGSRHTEILTTALTFSGCYGVYCQRPESEVRVKRAEELIKHTADDFVKLTFYMWSSEYYRTTDQMEKFEAHIEEARKLIALTGNMYMYGNLLILEFNNAAYSENFNPMFDLGLKTFNALPPKGYKGLKSACLHACTLAMTIDNRSEEALKYLVPSIDYSRESGEMESKYWTILSAVWYFGIIQQFDKSLMMFGALERFIKDHNYPLFGPIEIYFNKAKAAASKQTGEFYKNALYEKGWQMTIDDALIQLTALVG